MRAMLEQVVASAITSARLRTLRRRRHAFVRQILRRRPLVRFFHQVDDPYSVLAIQAVPLLKERYDIDIEVHPVTAPDMAAAPEPKMLAAYGLRDAELLARHTGFSLDASGLTAIAPAPSAAALAAGDALRRKLGHYLGATFHFEGEWFWGLDRLSFLEERLAPFRRSDAPGGFIAPRREIKLEPVRRAETPPLLEAFISFRSPYTYLAIDRLVKLASHYGADLRLRFVLPMVMRGLPVPLAKRIYIVRDCKREAERLGLPFGRISDPVGAGAERGLSVLHHAIREGLGPQFAASFLQGVFAEGMNAASKTGLMRMAQRAGLSRAQVRNALGDPSWREVAEENREAMFTGGVWGVPAFRVQGGDLLWGQDRLWAIEDELRAACEKA
ncbi:DSBA oxidoreductase [Parvibaculum lavamentivorans DS-1]|uniref:DSBA oxidoreductase n=2 Tax=Parvibaculum lavamentivorans TaxID=256618 RepID=A7HPF8_PARL1|nr:DSBA oxidoreductase [Parvibaculum lavamentivorans DS-1]